MIMEISLGQIVECCKAAGDHTRLRLLALCRLGDMSVGDLVDITEQSQPSISRHLKILHSADLLERRQDGAFVFYRIGPAPAVQRFLDLIADTETTIKADQERYEQRERARHEAIAQHFAAHAKEWDELRGSYLNADEVDALLSNVIDEQKPKAVLDIGTGTGHILKIISRFAHDIAGIDISRDMLSLARKRLEGCVTDLRRADMNQLPFEDDRFDLVTMHLSLRHASRPDQAIKEAARVLSRDGTLIVIDLEEGAGVSDDQHRSGLRKNDVENHMQKAGMALQETKALTSKSRRGYCWQGTKIS